MARRSQHSFLKRQKEMKRKDRGLEKMARRHGKSSAPTDAPEDEQRPADAGEEAPDAGEQAPDHADNEAGA